MLEEIKEYFSPFTDSINKLRKYLSDRTLITDLISKLVITFGVVLIVGGLYLMITDTGTSTQAAKTMLSAVNWVPGIPFYIADLENVSASIIGLALWIVGLDLLFVGLGLWVRNELARFAALAIFALSAYFQLIQFLHWGIIGAPIAAAQLCADGVLGYFLFSKFDQKTNVIKQLSLKATS
jgi:lysylphosphatidylglycerol synthetase-like protein (DUF2156 family)